MSQRRVVVTGMGVVTPFGSGVTNLLKGLKDARTATQTISGLQTDGLRCQEGGEIDDGSPTRAGFDVERERVTAFGVEAGQEALAHAALSADEIQLLAVGQGTGEIRAMEEIAEVGVESLLPQIWSQLPMASAVTYRISQLLAPRARTITFTNACSASSSAIGFCLDAIRAGEVDVALVGGIEILTRPTMAGFNALHALSVDRCRPFSFGSSGTLLGEGAAWLVLEDADRARARDARPLAEVNGYGSSSDAYHPTRPDPLGRAAVAAMKQALGDACLSASDLDYINAHGTGTFHNDVVEVSAIAEVLGDSIANVPISSTKSQIGHGVHACGAIEAVVCVLAISENLLPPTTNWEGASEEFAGYDFVANSSRSAQIDHALSNSFSFGGFNASLVFSRARS